METKFSLKTIQKTEANSQTTEANNQKITCRERALLIDEIRESNPNSPLADKKYVNQLDAGVHFDDIETPTLR